MMILDCNFMRFIQQKHFFWPISLQGYDFEIAVAATAAAAAAAKHTANNVGILKII